MPVAISSSASACAALLAGLVAVVGDEHSLRAVLLERREVILGEAVHAVAGGHVADSPRTRTSARRSAPRTG